LGNARFLENAPPEVVEKENERLREGEARILRIRENIGSLSTSD